MPLAINWPGLGDAAKVMVIFFAAFVPTVIVPTATTKPTATGLRPCTACAIRVASAWPTPTSCVAARHNYGQNFGQYYGEGKRCVSKVAVTVVGTAHMPTNTGSVAVP